MGCSGSVGRGPGPLRATRDRTPANASRDSWRCESIGSEHRRCLAKKPTFVGIEHDMRDARKRSTQDVLAARFGVFIGTIQRHECRNDDLRLRLQGVPDARAGIDAGGTRGAGVTGAGASASHFTGRCWGRTAPSTSTTSSPSPAPSASMPNGLRATWRMPALDALIGQNAVLANALGVRGTPAFVIGDGMIRGALPLEQFRAAIADARGRAGRHAESEWRRLKRAPRHPDRISGRRRGPRRVVRGYDRAGSTMMRPRPRLSR